MGLGHVVARRGRLGDEGDRRRRPPLQPRRREAAGSLRPVAPRSAQCRARGRRQPVAADPQARRRGSEGLGPRTPPTVREVGAHERRGEGRASRDVVEQCDLGAPHGRRARRARRGREGRRQMAARRAHAVAHQPRQGALPREEAPPCAHEARPHPALRMHRTGDAPLSRRPSGESAPLPGRHHEAGVLAQGGAGVRARLDPPVAQPRGRPRRDRRVPGARLSRVVGVGRELLRHRGAPLDVAARRHHTSRRGR